MISICLLLMLGPTTILAAVQFITNGSSGPQCGNYSCLGQNQSACEVNKCVCQEATSKGIGNFLCVREDESFAVIFNDPMVRGFDGSHTKIVLVNKFLACHISTTTCTGATPENVATTDGMCDFRFFVWGRKKFGKTFVGGIEVHIMVWVGNTSYHHSTRVEAAAFNGLHIYTEEGNTDPFEAGEYDDPVTTSIPGLGIIHTVYDEVDNFARIVAEPCGIEVGIRGVEKFGNALLQPAGAYIKVLLACEPIYLSNDNSVFSPPIGHGRSLDEQARVISEAIGVPVTPTLVAVFKSFPGQHMQDFPNAPKEVARLADTVRECEVASLFRALPLCMIVIEIPRVFKCLDKSSDGSVAIGLLDECLFCICDSNPFMCLDVQNKIAESRCLSKLPPSLPSILNFDCKSLGP